MQREPGGGDTPVRRVHERLLALSVPVSGLGEEGLAERSRVQAALVEELVRAPAVGLEDVWRKVTWVGERLRQEGHVRSSAFGALTLLLLDSARDDLLGMAAFARRGGERRELI